MDSEALALIQSLITAVNTYAAAMEMAAWSQATATANATTLAASLNGALAAYTGQEVQEGRLT
jgi:hypothetical protein